MASYLFSVPGLGSCCAEQIKHAVEIVLRDAHSDVVVEVDTITHEVSVITAESISQHHTVLLIKNAISSTGYSADRKFIVPHWVQGLIGLATGLAVLLFCLFSVGLPFWAMVGVGVASVMLTFALGWQSFKRAWFALRKDKKLTMDSLFVVSTVLVATISLASLFVPFLPMMFEVGLLIFGFRQTGLAIEASLIKHIRAKTTFQKRLPETIEVKRAGEWVHCSLEKIKIGERIRVHPEKIIPLDAILKDTSAPIDDELISGSKHPRIAQPETVLLSGVVLCSRHPVELEVNQTKTDSYLAKLDKSISEALKEREETVPPIRKRTARLLTYFVPTIFLLAVLSGLLVGCLVAPMLGVSCAIGVLVSACPCVLGLVVPISLLVGVSKAQTKRLHIMSGRALEEASTVNTLVFDFHGTLTKGRPVVHRANWMVSGVEETDAKQCLYAMESFVRDHPGIRASESYAKALLEHLQIQPALVDGSVQVDAMNGGVKMNRGDHTWYVGNRQMLRELKVEMGTSLQQESQWLFFVRDRQVIAQFQLSDSLRDGVAETLEQLNAQGFRGNIHVATGMCREDCDNLLSQLGPDLIDPKNIHYGQRAQDKADLIRQLTQQGMHVATIGEGPNDANMTANAALGVVMLSTAHEMTRQHGGVHIKGESLKPLQYLFPVAKQTFHLIYFNLIFSFMYNLCSVLLAGGVLLAAGIVLTPVVGAILMGLQVGVVLLVARYVHQKTVPLAPVYSRVPHSNTSSPLDPLQSLVGARQPNVPVSRLLYSTPMQSGSPLREGDSVPGQTGRAFI